MASTDEKKKNALLAYLENSYQEIRKVAWPTRNKAIRLTFLVLGFVMVVALIIGVLDYVFGIGNRAVLELAPDRALPTVQETESVQPVPEGDLPEGAIEVGDVTAVTGEEETTTPEETPTEEVMEEPAVEEEQPAEAPSS